MLIYLNYRIHLNSMILEYILNFFNHISYLNLCISNMLIKTLQILSIHYKQNEQHPHIFWYIYMPNRQVHKLFIYYQLQIIELHNINSIYLNNLRLIKELNLFIFNNILKINNHSHIFHIIFDCNFYRNHMELAQK